jgi:hypothetical protein
VKRVEIKTPKINGHASPEKKMGSRVMGQAASITVMDVRNMGRVIKAPSSIRDRMRGFPSFLRSLTNSASRIALRIATPASAIMPIMAVADRPD